MKHLEADDVVPTFRSDLFVQAPPRGNGAEVITLGPAGSNERVQIHGFEFSMARMLDGRRTAKEVMRNCTALGLPVTLSALEGFLRELELHGLLASGTGPTVLIPAEDQRSRASWTPEARAGYQQVLRAMREGRLGHARNLLAQLQAAAPYAPETRRLGAWLDEQLRQGGGHDFQKVYRQVEHTWRALVPGEAPPELRVRTTAREMVAVRRRPLLLAGVVLAVVVVGLFIPLPRLVPAAARLEPAAQQVGVADREGLIDRVQVTEGALVPNRAELFSWDVSELEVQVAELVKIAAETRTEASALPAEHPWLGPSETQAANDLNHEIARLQTLISTRSVLAPFAGVVRQLNVRTGARVNQGSTLFQLDQIATLEMVAAVTPDQARKIRAGDPVTVRVGDQRIATRVEAVTDNYEIVARLPNPGASLRAGSMAVDLQFKPTSIWQDRLSARR